MRKWLLLPGLLILLLAGCALALWLMRGSLVTSVVADACKDRGFVCEIERADVSLSSVTLSGLKVRDSANSDVAAATVDVDLVWPGLLFPKVSAIRLTEQPKLNLRYDGREVYLGNVPVSDLTNGEGGGSMPPLQVDNATLTIETPAGKVEGVVTADGTFPSSGKFQASLKPATLTNGPHELILNQGEADFTLSEDDLNGRLTLQIERASLPGQEITNAELSLDLSSETTPTLDWSLSADALSDSRIGGFSDVQAVGSLDLYEVSPQSTSATLNLIETVTASVTAGPSNIQDRRAETLTAQLRANRPRANSPFQFEAEAAFSNGTGPIGTAKRGTVTLQGSADAEANTLSATGRIVVTDVAASARASATVTNAIPSTTPLEAHGEIIRRALESALQGFSASADFGLTSSKTSPFALTLNGPVALKSNSGANLLLTPAEGMPALSATGEKVSLSGLLSARGGGFPNVTTYIREFLAEGESLQLETGGMTLSDWTAGGVTLGADLTRFSARQNAGQQLSVSGNGKLRLNGPVMGVGITSGELFGSLTALRNGKSWRVQTDRQSCLGLNYDRLRLAADLTLAGSKLRLCPPEGRLLSSGPQGVTGQLSLGDIALPARSGASTGVLQLSDTKLDWRGGSTLELSVTAETINLPLEIDTRDMTIAGRSPTVKVQIGRAFNINAALNQASLSGSLVPANIGMTRLSLDGQFAGRGFKGSAKGTDVRISDFRDQPLYNPLLGELSADFNGANMTLEGPFRLASTGSLIGTVNADINLLTLTGTAQVVTPNLQFGKDGLRPKNITDRLEGVFTNGTGRVNAQADFRLNNGKLEGNGAFTLDGFSFETLRLGPVIGINGTVTFDDLIALSTPPGQQLTIARIDPGLILNNGTVKFQILRGTEARIESATWPFAGGALTVDPSIWTISGTKDTLQVRADRIELKDLIETLKVPNLEAEGTLSGVFPIELTTGATLIRDARFKVDEEGGRLAYTGGMLNGAGGENQTVNDAFRALQNFQYSVLEISLNGNLLGDITLGALLLGRNPDVLGGSQFEFDIAIDSKLAQLLQTGREASSSQWLAEAVARQVEEKNTETTSPQD